MQTSAMPLCVRMKTHARNGSLRIEVANTGRWQANGNGNGKGTGTGLENVRQRLEQLGVHAALPGPPHVG